MWALPDTGSGEQRLCPGANLLAISAPEDFNSIKSDAKHSTQQKNQNAVIF
jgi:hypothetical protein